LLILNKVDLLPNGPADAESLGKRILGDIQTAPETPAVCISARTGEGIDQLLRATDEILPFDRISRIKFRFPAGDGASIHLLHEYGRVLNKEYDASFCKIEADVSDSLKAALADY